MNNIGKTIDLSGRPVVRSRQPSRTGINLVAGLEQEEWRAKNRRFKRDLEEQLGPEELKHFKVPVKNNRGIV